MTQLSLFDALTMISDGKAAETLERHEELRLKSSSDIQANFVYAHALEACGHHSRAQAVWETVNTLQAKHRPTPETLPLNEYPQFHHTDQLKSKLNKIFSENGSDDLQDLIVQLNKGEHKPFNEEFDLDEDDLIEEAYDGANTETYARILVTQQKYLEAAEIYRSLSEESPEQKERLLGEALRLEDLANQKQDS